MSMQSTGEGTQEWKARDAAQAVKERGREALDVVQHRAEDAGAMVSRTVQDQPVISLLGAFALGIAFGALISSSSSRNSGYFSDNLLDRVSEYEPSSLRRWRRRNNW
jgi:hypothetical protein